MLLVALDPLNFSSLLALPVLFQSCPPFPSLSSFLPLRCASMQFEYPHVAFNFTTLKQLRSTPVLLRVWTPGGGPCCGLELMGEFLEVEAGAVAAAGEPAVRKCASNGGHAESKSGGGAAGGSGRCMLFMGSPRISGLEELKVRLG